MTLLLILTAFGLTTPAQAAENFFPVQGTYLVVDNSGQNLVLELSGKDGKYLNVAYGPRGSGKLTFKLQTGGWKPLPKIGGPLPNEPKGKYLLTWAERSIKLEAESEREEGIHCSMTMGFGYDTYVPENSSFKIKTVTKCTGEEIEESEATLYGF